MTPRSVTHTRPFFVREPFCGLSHGLGACLAVVGLLTLLHASHGDPWRLAAFTLYGTSLVCLYTISALYHSLRLPEEVLDRWQRWDHIAIFLFLVGTYAPLCLVSLRGPWGWSLGGTVCFLALIGIGGSRPRHGLPDWTRVLLYAVIGWLAALATVPLERALTPHGFGWLLAGGLAYTAGGLIFAADRPHLWPGRFNAHDLWHLFVLAGSACHFLVMLRYVAPGSR
jgi:hemolysin III